AKLTGTITGDYTIVPEYNNEPVGSLSATVTLTAGAPVEKGVELSTFTAVPLSIIADNTAYSTLTFTDKEKYGKLVGQNAQ
ncbi:hypothetical protein H3U94_11930, partial [Bartonella sp. W8125]|uniref:hypothetical protein n=1 Tax=Bartonella TaxID=773 RepID=UPI0018DE878D